MTARLGYDSYTFGDDVVQLTSPPEARFAFHERVAAAKKKGVTVTDETTDPNPKWGPWAKQPKLMQFEWRGDAVHRAWFTAQETSRGFNASKLVELALEQPAFARTVEIGVGLEQWENSHQASFDAVVDVLASKRPALSALAFGDYVNESGHVLELKNLARLDDLYPSLESLRLSTTQLPRFDQVGFKHLKRLWVRTTWRDAAAFKTLARSWPHLESLGIGWHRSGSKEPAETLRDWGWLLDGQSTPKLRHLTLIGSNMWPELIGALVTSPTGRALKSLDLRSMNDPERGITEALAKHAQALTYLESVRLPAGFHHSKSWWPPGVDVRCGPDRSQPNHRD